MFVRVAGDGLMCFLVGIFASFFVNLDVIQDILGIGSSPRVDTG